MDMRVWMVGVLIMLGLAAPFLVRRRRMSPLWMVAGALILGVLTGLVVRRGDNLSELTPTRLAHARERWADAALGNYECEVLVRADRLDEGRFELEVRDGHVARARHNGVDASGRADAYSIAGLFEILQRELELSERPSQGFGAPAGYRAYLHARFHDTLGYPEVYRRSVGGTSNAIEIRVVRLQPR